MNELRKCIHCIPLWGFKSGAKSLQSGASSKTKNQQRHNKKQTPQPTPQTTPNKNKTQKGTWHDGSKKQWHQVLLNSQILHKNIKTTNKKTTAQDHAKVFSKTHRPAMPKPRIPPARIPEIALRSLPASDTFAIEVFVQRIINFYDHIGRHPTVWGSANYCEVDLYHIHAHYSQWCKVTALLTPAQAIRHG